MTRFTYFEPLIDGHCTFWASIVLSRVPEDPRINDVRLVASPQMIERLKEIVTRHQIKCEVIRPRDLARMTTGSLWQRGQAQWRMAKHMADNGIAFLPFFDHAVIAAATDPVPVSTGGRVSGIIFRPPNSYNLSVSFKARMDALRRWGSYALARRTTGGPLFTLDELAPLGKVGRVTKALKYLPDPAPDLQSLDCSKPALRADRRGVVLVFGALTQRKGIFQTLQAWHHLSTRDRARFALRFVGRLGEQERPHFMHALATARDLMPEAVIELLDDFVTEEQLANEVAAAQIILAPYQNHIGSSGVMHWAVAANKPLIAQDTGLIGYQVSKNGLGAAIDCTDPQKIAFEVAAIAKQGCNQRRDFAAEHTADAFVSNILKETLNS